MKKVKKGAGVKRTERTIMRKDADTKRKYTVAFDLDGTLADCKGGWEKYSDFPGNPLPGVKYNLQRLRNAGFKIGVYTTRNYKDVYKWLEKHGLLSLVDWVNENPSQPPNTGVKPFADYYVDDRGIRFEGDMDSIVDRIIKGTYIPWQEKDGENEKLSLEKYFVEVLSKEQEQEIKTLADAAAVLTRVEIGDAFARALALLQDEKNQKK